MLPQEKLRPCLHLHSSLWGGRQESFGLGHHGYKVHFCLGINAFSFLISEVRVRTEYSPGGFTVLTATSSWISLHQHFNYTEPDTFCVVYFLLIFDTIYVAQAVFELTFLSLPDAGTTTPGQDLLFLGFCYKIAFNQMFPDLPLYCWLMTYKQCHAKPT